MSEYEEIGEIPEEGEELKSAIIQLRRTLSHLTTPLGNKDIAIAELQASNEMKDEKLQRTQHELSIARAKIEEMQDTIDELKEELKDDEVEEEVKDEEVQRGLDVSEVQPGGASE